MATLPSERERLAARLKDLADETVRFREQVRAQRKAHGDAMVALNIESHRLQAEVKAVLDEIQDLEGRAK